MTRTLIALGFLMVLATPMASALYTEPVFQTVGSYSCADNNGTHDCVGNYGDGCWGVYVERDGEIISHYGVC